MVAYRSPIFDGVDPRLSGLIQSVGDTYGPYGVRTTSGYRKPGGIGGQGYHPKGTALDVELYDRKTGKALPNYHNNPENFGAYQQFANSVYGKADPETQKLLRWGGYFSGGPDKYGALDLMHFDLGGAETPMAGGSWAGGLSPEQAKIYNIAPGGGIGGSAGGVGGSYTPDQRRAAIAAIESAGSGDYNALGAWTGDPESGRDRAYGKYQMMGANIPKWTQQVLGRTMTPDEFIKDPKAQDAVFDKIFGDYAAKYGEEGAANMWFSGRPDVTPAKDVNGMDVATYGARYLKGLGAGSQAPGSGAPTQPGAAIAGSPPGAPDIKARDDRLDAAGDAVGNLGAMFTGTGKTTAAVPAPVHVKPAATMTQGGPNQIIDPGKADATRQKLAMAMARLNSGKLWG